MAKRVKKTSEVVPPKVETHRDDELKLHRDDDLPAVVVENGASYWFQHGKQHRDNDQPAVVHPDGTKEWFVDDKPHRENGLPAVDGPAGQWWAEEGKWHRFDGPARIFSDGTDEWWVYGEKITDLVHDWIEKNRIKLPFNERALFLFKRDFG